MKKKNVQEKGRNILDKSDSKTLIALRKEGATFAICTRLQ